MPPTNYETSKHIADDLVFFISGHDIYDPASFYKQTMRDLAENLPKSYGLFYQDMVRDLKMTRENAADVFIRVVHKMLEDGAMNWGRVVAIYSLAAFIGRHFFKGDGRDHYPVEAYAKAVATALATQLTPWIEENGGWEAFEEFFTHEDCKYSLWSQICMASAGVAILTVIKLILR